MTNLPKFSGPDLDDSIEFAFPDIWEREDHDTWARLRIGCREREIPLILSLCKSCTGPFGILYVLVCSRLGREEARYQSPEPVSFNDLEQFLNTFRAFFEQDGRHHLWVMSLEDGAQFVFDNHNVIYAYGNLDRFERLLREHGYRDGNVEIPIPHAHHYHPELDAAEDELFSYWDWKAFALSPSDDP